MQPSFDDLQLIRQEDDDPNPILPSLPQELILEILLRLPVRSLLKFRCVSKPWRLLITSSKFMKSHLKKSTDESNGDYVNRCLLLVSMDFFVTVYSCSLYSVLYENFPVKLHDVEPPNRAIYPSTTLLGSCNGIFGILEGYHDIILWNPAIRQLNRLPYSGTNYRRFKIFTYGFGYDKLNDDYKAVEICCYARLGTNRQTIVNVYSLRSNSWRRIKDYEGGIISCSPGVFINGVLHWHAIHRDGFNTTTWSILSLDISSDTHETTLMQPPYENGFLDPRLGILKGRLCAFCNYYQVRMDLWMMDEYGKKESWFKFATIPYPPGCTGRFWPLFVSKSGEILLQNGYSLMLYNQADGKFKESGVKMDDFSSLEEVGTYTESFVSPHVYDIVRDQN